MATLYPLLVWHVSPETRRFAWFMAGDFFAAGWAASLLPSAQALWLAALLVFVLEHARKVWRERRFELGKVLVVLGTALTWYVGIVATNGDFEFTVTNVLPHGVPYLALLYFYARERRREVPQLLGSRLVSTGLLGFFGVCLLAALLEEGVWARWIFHDHAEVFGVGQPGQAFVALLAPLLVVPQAVHYALDGLLWRRGDTASRPAQRAALGLASAR
jgi:hypothetical protein